MVEQLRRGEVPLIGKATDCRGQGSGDEQSALFLQGLVEIRTHCDRQVNQRGRSAMEAGAS